ncbi:alternative ribosome rescue aminoacyl-tRNA hydrolase ArfB [Lutibaculum baratangense]|uniref:Prokaryotic-type class I peptide chain release factors domain-containing protein n=1 Tax=Lutibaculum baratangense AMV1 TaxID=631454 RepID=V4R0L4_9HYPH|nr:alternative ribosome rescue aminoacyl-tRNA hydrolase ArfB [Lutibaculum baratangense]ESR25532.1 Hypothetical protein YaeJ with similarity to translation release factor [Lutibaculum baratangense AMV1]
MIEVAPGIALDESELQESFVRASGPGGQHVNKASTAVQLRFDARRSRALPDDVAIRLMKAAGSRLTREGVIVITADAHRSQQQNRDDARERLFEMIREAARRPVARRPTKPTRAAKQRRLEAKGKRAAVKSQRTKPILD